MFPAPDDLSGVHMLMETELTISLGLENSRSHGQIFKELIKKY